MASGAEAPRQGICKGKLVVGRESSGGGMGV